VPISRILTGAAAAVAVISALIAAIGLAHALASGNGPDMIIHELEAWMATTAYHLVLILLATAVIQYLARKK
jgi:hypothetical protein